MESQQGLNNSTEKLNIDVFSHNRVDKMYYELTNYKDFYRSSLVFIDSFNIVTYYYLTRLTKKLGNWPWVLEFT